MTASTGTDLMEADAAIKHVLELIHELNDQLRPGRWSQDGWSEEDLLVWTAYLGARNAAHHGNGCLIEMHQASTVISHARWSPDVTRVRSATQTDAYRDRLRGEPVFPLLGEVAALVVASISDRR